MLRSAFLLLTTATVSFAQVEDILANAGGFKPRITVSDHYSEKVVVETMDDNVFRSLEANPQRIAITVVANLDGAETGAINADTTVGMSAGHFDHSATLGDAEDYKPTSKRVTFPLYKEVEEADGDLREVRVGAVIYAWTAKTLTVTITCTDIVGAGVSEVAASDFAGIAEAGTSVSFSGEPIEVAVTFGDATGGRRAFLKGISKTVTRGFGSVAAETYEEFYLVDVNLQGAADVTGPVVKASFPAKASAAKTIDVDGTATDLTAVTFAAVTVNGIATDAASLDMVEDGAGGWTWSVIGLPLKKGTNAVALTFTDEDGNLTKVSRSYAVK